MTDDTKVYNNDEVEVRSAVDGVVMSIKGDSYSGSLSVMSSDHVRIHSGDGFSLSGEIAALAAGASTYFYLKPTIAVHWRYYDMYGDAAPFDVEFFEDPTVTDDGSLATVINRNRLSSHTSGANPYTGPTVTDDGTLLDLDRGLASGQGQTRAGELQGIEVEWILDPSSTYLLKLTNNDSSAGDFIYKFFWYELDL